VVDEQYPLFAPITVKDMEKAVAHRGLQGCAKAGCASPPDHGRRGWLSSVRAG